MGLASEINKAVPNIPFLSNDMSMNMDEIKYSKCVDVNWCSANLKITEKVPAES